jgi:hypothetical protein
MLRNRIIYLAFLVCTVLYASFYGGNIAYMLFHLAILLPIFCLAYTLYVNLRFKIHQTIDRVKLVKKEAVPYNFILANEDIFTFSSIQVSFFDDKSHIAQDETGKVHCLMPKSNNTMSGTIYGDYRGTYEVGAKNVEIMDFLYLFKVNYPIRSRLRMIVSPRVISIEKLKLASFIMDSAKTRQTINPMNETVDTQLRKYVKGDNRKMIHWKASAKKQELLTKKYTDIEELETLLVLDLQKISDDLEIKLIAEDKIIELSLAIANNFFQNAIPIRVLYETSQRTNHSIRTAKDFQLFYQLCTDISFSTSNGMNHFLGDVMGKYPDNDYFVLILAALDYELYDRLYKMGKKGKQITLFYIRTTMQDSNKFMLQALSDTGICVYDIWMDDDLEELFGAKTVEGMKR